MATLSALAATIQDGPPATTLGQPSGVPLLAASSEAAALGEGVSATYWLHGPAVAGGGRYTGPDAVVIDGSRVSIRSGCAPVLARVSEIDVNATWPSCVATNGAVALKVSVDQSLGIIQGFVDIGGARKPLSGSTALGDMIRIGTFNVQYLPSTIQTKHGDVDADADGEIDTLSAQRIAERIKASKYDVIALNEVQDEDARDGDGDPGYAYSFVKNLSSAYPHRVAFLNGDGTVGQEDSGLMLLSRFPFEALPNSAYQTNQVPLFTDHLSHCKGTECEKVAFLEYQECEGDDCLAEKGFGLVRIKNPETGHIYNVGFSHLQASYDDYDQEDANDVWDVRNAQFADMKKVIEATLTDQQLQTEDIFVLGDLNVDGDLSDEPTGSEATPQNLYEWNKYFGTVGSFFHDRLRDTWAFDTSPDDLGYTNLQHWGPGAGRAARLDYILRSTDTRLCVQHATRSYNLRWGDPYVESGIGEPGTESGAANLSDHIGLTADVGPEFPHCSAALARTVDLEPGVNLLDGAIPYPGAMQWFRIDAPGTYSFEVPGDLDFHLYQSTDLSTPLVPYKKKTAVLEVPGAPPVEAKTFLISEAPFYIRVFDAERTGIGPYSIWGRRHRCTDKEDACLLAPSRPLSETFPANLYYGSNDAFWFELDTEKADSGEAQQLELSTEHGGSSQLMSLELRASDGVTTVATDATADPGGAGFRLRIARKEAAADTFFLLVQRSDPAPQVAFVAGWTTDLNVFFGSHAGVAGAVEMRLFAREQEDELGDDDIYVILAAGGQHMLGPSYIGEFDNGSSAGIGGTVGVRRFVGTLSFTVVEENDGYDGGEGDDSNDDIAKLGFLPLLKDVPCALDQRRQFSFQNHDGDYELSFNLCHGLPT